MKYPVITLLLVVCVAASALAQSALPVYDGPPPQAPETIARDGDGRITVRAVRLLQPLRVDGRLDETLYQDTRPASDFLQIDPSDGAPATERTEVWVSYDADNVYVSFRATESQPDRLVATEMRRDSANLKSNDHVGFILDTFYDRRNGVEFTVTPLAGRGDGQTSNEQVYGGDWNPVWDVRTTQIPGGWTVEASVPFKSLRFRPGQAQIWGFNAVRFNRAKNETSYLVPVPRSWGTRGLKQLSQAAVLVGIEAPGGSRNLELKPYVTADLTTDRLARPARSNDASSDIGFDAKYGLTRSLTLDFTYNTDFAQVEADEQQINLTRFNLFFPEKREFFLENAGIFAFGGGGGGGGAGGGGGGGGAPPGGGGGGPGGGGGDVPILFYSRRIGLEQGHAIPIHAGGRLSGRVGRFTVGALAVGADNQPAFGVQDTAFTLFRARRDVLRRSSVGAIYTGRRDGRGGTAENDVFGVDGNFAFFQNLRINSYFAQSRTAGLDDGVNSYQGQIDYNGDRYGFIVERLVVEKNFRPGIGFVRRADMAKYFADARFSPRPRSSRLVRRYSFRAQHTYIENTAGHLETRTHRAQADMELHSGDLFGVSVQNSYEFVAAPFRLSPAVSVPQGGYDFTNAQMFLAFGQQRPVSGVVMLELGSFYGGTKMGVTTRGTRINVSNQLALEPSYSINRVELPHAAFTSHLSGSRVVYTMTPLMFVSALLQYNSTANALSSNVRLRWEYRPGSELFIVYNDERDTLARSFPALQTRAFIVKVNRLFRF